MSVNHRRYLSGGVIRGYVLCAHEVFNFEMNVQTVLDGALKKLL